MVLAGAAFRCLGCGNELDEESAKEGAKLCEDCQDGLVVGGAKLLLRASRGSRKLSR
jgi:hypothetical protein